MKTWILFAALFPLTAAACIWDAQSLSHEKSRSHDLAQTILGEPQVLEDTNQLRATLKDLETNRKEDDINWWNNLAGTYLRLNQPQDAVKLLEPVVAKFPDDYGIHANLGTAYHLLGRYQDAAKEIARDLEINPEAHFGLEKYHLALLQYLARDSKYQSRHVYVDELTTLFLISDKGWNFDPGYGEMEEDDVTANAEKYATVEVAEEAYQTVVNTNAPGYQRLHMLATVAARDGRPEYRKFFDLHHDTNLVAGVIYMAQMNSKEPACHVMLGIAAWEKQNYHLAISAFENAIAMGSPQTDMLKKKIEALQDFIQRSQSEKRTMRIFVAIVVGVPVAWVAWLILRFVRGERLKTHA